MFPSPPSSRCRWTSSAGAEGDLQRCGTEELSSTPTVNLAPRFGPRHLIALNEEQEALRMDIEELRARLGNVGPANLRSRVAATETAIDELRARLDDLERRVAEADGADSPTD